MEQCWAANPSYRPLLGNVQPILEKIMKKACEQDRLVPIQRKTRMTLKIFFSSQTFDTTIKLTSGATCY